MNRNRNSAAAMKRYEIPATVLALTALFAFHAAPAPAQTWKPEKAVELIATNAPGGGSDRILRIMAKVLQEGKHVTVPVNVVNKPGGGGSVAYNYANLHPGDGHYLVLGNRSLLTANISGNGPSYTELTPVAKLFDEYISVTVRPDSPLKTGRDLIDRLKKDTGALSLGIATSIGNPNHQGVAAALKVAGVDFKKVRAAIFPSGGAATTAMFGGHVDVAPVTASFAASLLRNGQVRILAVAAPGRLPGVLAEVPTWREQGYDVVVTNWRAFIGPKGMTPAQLAYWETFLRRLSDADEWKKEMEANVWAGDFMGSADARRFMERDNADARAFLVDLGLAK